MTIRETLRPLSNTGFAWYLAGNTGSIVGTWAQRVALLWIAWELTQSTTVLGLLAMADLLPSVAIAPLAGTIADRYDRLSLAKMLQWVSVLPPMLLLGLSLSGQLGIEWIVAVAVATGVINGFDHPIRMVLVGSLVERARVGGAVALNSMTFNLARMIGPVFGGLAIAEKLFWPLFLFNCLSYYRFCDHFGAVEIKYRAPKGNGTYGCYGKLVGSFLQPQIGAEISAGVFPTNRLVLSPGI